MSTPVPPDVERLVARYLQAHTAVTALCREIVSRTPAATDGSWIRYQLIGRPTNGNGGMHFSGYLLQFDCYASRADNTREAASRMARTVEAALSDLVGVTEPDGAVVTGVPASTITSHRQPDDMLTPSRERYVVNAIVHAHGPL